MQKNDTYKSNLPKFGKQLFCYSQNVVYRYLPVTLKTYFIVRI